MTSLKAFICGGLRNALRRLLHKTPPPAGDGSGAPLPAARHLEGTNGGSEGQSTSEGRVGSKEGGDDFLSSNLPQQGSQAPNDTYDWSQALNGDFSNIVKSHANDDEATIRKNSRNITPHPNPFDTPTNRVNQNQSETEKNTVPRHNPITVTTPTTVTTSAAAITAPSPLTDSVATVPTTADDDSIMAPAGQPLTEQTRPTQKAPPSRRDSLLSKQDENKENVPPEDLEDSLAALAIEESLGKEEAATKTKEETQSQSEDQAQIDYGYLNDPVVAAERAQHLRFINEALDMARLALRINETPVGCVLVHDGKVIAKGMNATNVTRNGTRHAEYMALAALFSYQRKEGPKTTRLKPKLLTDREEEERAARLAARSDEEVAMENEAAEAACETMSMHGSPHDGNEDGKFGHLYPYGQKTIDVERVDRSIVAECILYVTVEPCIMCASLLRQLKIKKVYFGAVNDKFGGTGGVFSIHANSLPAGQDGETPNAHPIAKPIQLPDGTGGSLGVSFPPGGGDGGNVEHGYEIEGGWGRDDAVALLRRFYVQENGRAPVPRKKEGRAARLAALMEQDGLEGDGDATTSTGDWIDNGPLRLLVRKILV